jgi:tetratricopeptide (TPR) repeat protein
MIFSSWPALPLGLSLLAAAYEPVPPPQKSPELSARTAIDAAAAKNYVRQGHWQKAAETYRRVVEANPYDGDSWHEYADVLRRLGRYSEAISAAEKALATGPDPAQELYFIASTHALMRHTDSALEWLKRALEAKFNDDQVLRQDKALDSLREDPRFKALVGIPARNLTRDEQWRHDVSYLAGRLEQLHYNLYARIAREELQHKFRDLQARLPALKDREIKVSIQRILAMIGDGHTRLLWHSPESGTPDYRFPVEFYWYPSGLCVRAAGKEDAKVIGGRVLRIGEVSVDQALEAVTPLCSHDNAMGIKALAPQLLRIPEVLAALGLTKDETKLHLVVQGEAGEVAADLLPRPYAVVNDPKSMIYVNASAKNRLPLSRMHPDNAYWFEFLKDQRLMYFQFNAIMDKREESLAGFFARLFAFIRDNPVERLAIDLRDNGGGNNELIRPLIHGLIKCDKINRSGHLFVIVGRNTFSAAMNTATALERQTHALFVGEPTGSSPNHVGEATPILLPCTGTRIVCSSLLWQDADPRDRRPWIAPTLPAVLTLSDEATNHDPALAVIEAYLRLATPSLR